jgi:hypothetical protein
MSKIALIVVGVLIAGALVFAWPFGRDALSSAKQKRALQTRSDYPQITTACVTLAHTMDREDTLIRPADPRVPALLRSLSPRYISASTNYVRLEFHGGFEHYGYRVEQSATDSRQWTISYYTEQGRKPLTTISHD